MQLKEFDVLLDIKKHNNAGYFEVVQGDSYSNILKITLMDGLTEFSLTNTTVQIAFRKSDGTTVVQSSVDLDSPIIVTGNKIVCTLKTNSIAAVGQVLAEVKVLEGETLLTSARFGFYVRASLMNDEAIESTNEFPLLEKLVNDVDGVIATEAARVTAEEERKTSETSRITAETDRINTFSSYESRVANVEASAIAANEASTRANSAADLATTAATNANAKAADVENRFQQLTSSQQQDAEVVSARQSTSKSKTFASLDARLEEGENDLKTHKAENASKHNQNIPIMFGGNIGRKMIYQLSGQVFVVTRKPHGQGFVRFRLRDDLVDTSAMSAGGIGSLMRSVEVFNVPECFTIVKNGIKSPTGWGTDANIYYGSVQLPLYSANASVAGAYVEYDVVVPKGKSYCEVLIYGGTGSSENVTISIDGQAVLSNISFRRSPAKWERISVPCTHGTHKLRITINDAGYGSIAGVNVTNIDEYRGDSYDTIHVIYEGTTNQYITNGGAIDYAIQSADDGLFYGSYHGGEVRQSLKYFLDGKAITLHDGDYLIGNQFEVLQSTSIKSGALMTNSRYFFRYDGVQEFEVEFVGEMALKKLITNMTSTHLDYKKVLYPKNIKTDINGEYYFADGNRIVQTNEVNNQRITTILNNVTYPLGDSIVPYVQVSDYYNKVYRENIKKDDGYLFKGGNFYSAHIFE